MEQLTLVPTTGQFFLHEEETPLPGMRSAAGEALAGAGWPERALLVRGAEARGPIEGTIIELIDALPILAGLPADRAAPPSIGAWARAARLALDLVLRERVVPRLRGRPSREDDERIAGWEARWSVALAGAERGPLGRLARELGAPEAAIPVGRRLPQSGVMRGYAAPALLRRFLDLCADTLVREASRRGAFVRLGGWPADSWEQRLVRALGDDRGSFAAPEVDPEQLAEELRVWSDDEAEGPSLLPSPPSWQAPESLQAVLRRLLTPAAHLAERLLRGEPAPRTLTPSPAPPGAGALAAPVAAQRLSQSIAVARALIRLTGQREERKRQAG